MTFYRLKNKEGYYVGHEGLKAIYTADKEKATLYGRADAVQAQQFYTDMFLEPVEVADEYA